MSNSSPQPSFNVFDNNFDESSMVEQFLHDMERPLEQILGNDKIWLEDEESLRDAAEEDEERVAVPQLSSTLLRNSRKDKGKEEAIDEEPLSAQPSTHTTQEKPHSSSSDDLQASFLFEEEEYSAWLSSLTDDSGASSSSSNIGTSRTSASVHRSTGSRNRARRTRRRETNTSNAVFNDKNRHYKEQSSPLHKQTLSPPPPLHHGKDAKYVERQNSIHRSEEEKQITDDDDDDECSSDNEYEDQLQANTRLNALTTAVDPIETGHTVHTEISDEKELAHYYNKLAKLEIPQVGGWYEKMNIGTFETLFETLENLASLVSDDASVLSKRRLAKTHHLLCNMCMFNQRILSESLPAPERGGRTRTPPLVNIYLIACHILCRIGTHGHASQSSFEIAYCVDNLLCVSRSRIDCYNCEEVIVALNVLEQRLPSLGYCNELCHYLNSLETRIAHIMTFAHSAQVHNIVEVRQELYEKRKNSRPSSSQPRTSNRESSPTLYVCHPEFEFLLITRLCCLRMHLESALESLRVSLSGRNSGVRHTLTIDASPMYSIDTPDASTVERVTLNLAYEMSLVYSDRIDNRFRRLYQELSVSSAERLLFLRRNPSQIHPAPEDVIVQSRDNDEWRHIATKSRMNVGICLLEANDTLACRLAVSLIMKVVAHQECHLDWPSLCRDEPYLSTMNSLEYNSLLELSKHTPLFVYAANDAGVLYDKKLRVFGASPKSHMCALAFWLTLIEYLESKRRRSQQQDRAASLNSRYRRQRQRPAQRRNTTSAREQTSTTYRLPCDTSVQPLLNTLLHRDKYARAEVLASLKRSDPRNCDPTDAKASNNDEIGVTMAEYMNVQNDNEDVYAHENTVYEVADDGTGLSEWNNIQSMAPHRSTTHKTHE